MVVGKDIENPDVLFSREDFLPTDEDCLATLAAIADEKEAARFDAFCDQYAAAMGLLHGSPGMELLRGCFED